MNSRANRAAIEIFEKIEREKPLAAQAFAMETAARELLTSAISPRDSYEGDFTTMVLAAGTVFRAAAEARAYALPPGFIRNDHAHATSQSSYIRIDLSLARGLSYIGGHVTEESVTGKDVRHANALIKQLRRLSVYKS